MKKTSSFYPVTPLQVKKTHVYVMFERLTREQKRQFRNRFFKNGRGLEVDSLDKAFSFCTFKLGMNSRGVFQ